MTLNANLPRSVATKTMNFSQFKGVDFESELGAVSTSRSPDSINMISDQSGRPVKRFGYEKLIQLNARINGIFRLVKKEAVSRVIHSGTKLYLWKGDNTLAELYDGMNDARSTAFQMDSRLWILDGKKLLCYDGNTAVSAESIAYVPTSTIGALPAGGGTMKDQFNMLTPLRTNSFCANASATVYQLDARDIIGVEKCEKLNANGTWTAISYANADNANGKVTFTSAIGETPLRGEDNLKITYRKKNDASIINKCTTGVLWGLGGFNRLFVTGNPDYPNRDFVSDFTEGTLGLPTYFPENMYSLVGQDNTRIMGYLYSGEKLAILKEENGQDATVFLRTASMKSDDKGGDTISFPIKTGIAGVGAVSAHCMKNLRDDHMFLSRQGMFAISTNSITSEQYAQARSELINKKLCREAGISNAVATEHDGYLYVAVNSHVYVADAAQKNYKGKGAEQYQYEWYYWENVPVRCWFEDGGRLLFGTEDGRVMRFFNQKLSSSYNDDGAAILARWTTPEVSFDGYTRYKTLKCIYTKLNPYARSSVRIYLKDAGAFVSADEKQADVFRFEDLDFNRFTFNTDTDVNVIFTKIKLKKVVTTQLKFENNVKNEAFGLYGATVYYDIKSKVK
ncbi:MAG: hypothetical protein RR389_04970 [Christensenella sp.]